MTATTCYPWWHAKFAPMRGGPAEARVSSGCVVGANGNVNCSPEAMRAAAEIKLREGGWLPSLSLETYTLARYMQSEVGNGTIEERVAVGEVAINRARGWKLTPTDLLLNRQKSGHPNRGFYGPIHGPEGISTAPYGRWAATTQDPTILTTLLADLVTSGESGNFVRGGLDQVGPEHWVKDGQERLWNYVRGRAKDGDYWVGPLPGVNHWRTWIRYTPNALERSVAGPALLERGLASLTLPMLKPNWPDDLPICPKGSGGLVFVGILATALGAWWFTRRASRGVV